MFKSEEIRTSTHANGSIFNTYYSRDSHGSTCYTWSVDGKSMKEAEFIAALKAAEAKEKE